MGSTPAKKEKFEDHFRQVEEVLEELEGGKLELEESLEKYERGIKALRKCYDILAGAEKKVELLVKEKDDLLGTQDITKKTDA